MSGKFHQSDKERSSEEGSHRTENSMVAAFNRLEVTVEDMVAKLGPLL